MGLKPVKVSQLNSYIKRILQTDPILGNISVTGEISNLKFHSSGHVYFSLKDESSRLNCFLSAGNLRNIDCELQEGAEVIADGFISVYERGGSYSLNVRSLQYSGQGDLAAAFERLKSKLEREGIFDADRKKEIPFFPRKVAVVTSPTGAAVRDIVKIITSKNDCVDILIYPVLVQGPNAAAEISSAIDDLSANYRDIDVIITGRGGGSMEELWSFNEEIVARSMYECSIPVISAVGHETDFTIADFAADLRAETPTAAADKAVPDTHELREYTESLKRDMLRGLHFISDDRKRRLELLDPQSFARDIRSRIALEEMNTENMISNMQSILSSRLDKERHRTELLRESLEAANPKAILAKGYSVVTDENGSVIGDISKMKINQTVRIETSGGRAAARITDIETKRT